MGNCASLGGLNEEMLDEYRQLLYLTRAEILSIYRKFRLLDQVAIDADITHRIQFTNIQEQFPVLKYNPFADRLCDVFSSRKDGCFSLDDMLDLCSAFSANCPDKMKALWAFRVYDFDNDMQIGQEDINEIIQRLTLVADTDKFIQEKDKDYIAQTLLREMDLQHTGSMGQLEFQHAIGKMSEFPPSFTFRV